MNSSHHFFRTGEIHRLTERILLACSNINKRGQS
jgi:hypothetical protein